jgi:hypothetical protein
MKTSKKMNEDDLKKNEDNKKISLPLLGDSTISA